MSDIKRQGDMDDASPDSGEAFASRRRVIKGLASAVPAILTVSSGAAIAASSSNLQCIDKTTATHPTGMRLGDPTGGTAADSWQSAYESDYLGEGPVNINADIGDTDTDDVCLTYVDSSGTRVMPNEGGNPVLTSCYNSFT